MPYIFFLEGTGHPGHPVATPLLSECCVGLALPPRASPAAARREYCLSNSQPGTTQTDIRTIVAVSANRRCSPAADVMMSIRTGSVITDGRQRRRRRVQCAAGDWWPINLGLSPAHTSSRIRYLTYIRRTRAGPPAAGIRSVNRRRRRSVSAAMHYGDRTTD